MNMGDNYIRESSTRSRVMSPIPSLSGKVLENGLVLSFFLLELLLNPIIFIFINFGDSIIIVCAMIFIALSSIRLCSNIKGVS